MENLQTLLITKTLTRIAIPSFTAALVCYLTFPSITASIFDFANTAFDGVERGTGYETLNLILTDNSNQFIQNAHNFLALNFCFLTSFTFSFLYNNQVTLYEALFEEVSVLISLMEQIALSSEGRTNVYQLLLSSIQTYVNEDLKVVTDISSARNQQDSDTDNKSVNGAINERNGGNKISEIINYNQYSREDLPSILVSQRPQNDPLETILYLTSVGQPSYIYSTIRSLRQARAKRLASLQRKIPELNMYLLYILGFMAWVTFPIVTAGSYTVGGDELVHVFRNELSLGVWGMGCVLGILNELKQPEVGSAYNVDYSILGTLMDGLEKELDVRLKKCEVNGELRLVQDMPSLSYDDNDADGRNRGTTGTMEMATTEVISQTGIRLIQQNNGVDENELNNSNSSTTKRKKIRRRILDRIRNRNQNRVRKKRRRFFIL